MNDPRPNLADLARIADHPGPTGARSGDCRRDGGESPSSDARLDPDPSACGDLRLRIARDGTWFYHGSPIARKPLARLFSTILRRDSAGDYWLVTPVERERIQVDDAPFVAVELTAEGSGEGRRLVFRTNLDDLVVAGRDHPIRVVERPAEGAGVREPAPYVLVRERLEARIARPVFYQLVDMAIESRVDGRPALGVWSDGVFFVLGTTA